MNELVDGRPPGEEQDDSRKHPLPRAPFQTAAVDRPFRVSERDQLPHSCDSERELITESHGAAHGVGVHAAMLGHLRGPQVAFRPVLCSGESMSSRRSAATAMTGKPPSCPQVP